MFTGIIEEIGFIKSISSDKITINCSKVLENTKLGDSIAVNGICLTVTELMRDGFCADVSQETFKVSALSELKHGSIVNLERALTLSTRLGGHLVSGHIDTVGTISKILKQDEFYKITVKFPSEYNKYVIKKGSISINGISLTIADCGNDFVTIAVIPHTFDMTVLKGANSGDKVNLEFDILAKYVEKNLASSDNKGVTIDLLAENGFI